MARIAREARPAIDFFPTICGCATPGSVDVTFDSVGIPVDLSLPDGGTLPDAVRACVLGAIGSYCFPSVAGTSQSLTGAHCWIA